MEAKKKNMKTTEKKTTKKELKWTVEKLAALKAARDQGKSWNDVGAVFSINGALARSLVTKPIYIARLKSAPIDPIALIKEAARPIAKPTAKMKPTTKTKTAKAPSKPPAPRKKK